jgi:hypothetical protein
MASFIVDFEGYQICGKFFPKEIAFLNTTTNHCFQYYIKWSWDIHNSTTNWQMRRHCIPWSDGEMLVDEAIEDARKKILMTDVLWVKGDQKLKYIQSYWFPYSKIKEITDAPPIRNLNSFPDKTCFMHRGKRFCATRKVFELSPYVCNLHRVQRMDDLTIVASQMSVDKKYLERLNNVGECDIPNVNFPIDKCSDSDSLITQAGDLMFYDADDEW